ncbi:hypothetical protein LUZ60_009613 [Juncus effusus]|nr:hypothetical protein LUZ60_009613 [Juncus effusus]
MASLLSPSSLSFSHRHSSPPKSNKISLLLLHTSSRLLHVKPSFALKIPTQAQFHQKLFRISCDRNPTSVFQSITKGAALFLFGSFLFLAGFNSKPVFAINVPQKGNLSSPLKENRKAQQDERKNKDDEMIEMYEKFLEQKPNDLDGLKIVLYAKLRKGKMEEALQYIERLEILDPGDVEWKLLEAVAYEQMGRLSEAKNVYREILDNSPFCSRALHGLALVMHKNQEGPAVFEMINKALELAVRENRVTEERNIKILIAMMHIVKEDLNGAAEKLEDLTNEDPRDFRPYLCKGIIYSLMDRKKEADEQFEIYDSLVPDEFPQRGFLEDCILAAKSESQFGKDFVSEFSNRS